MDIDARLNHSYTMNKIGARTAADTFPSSLIDIAQYTSLQYTFRNMFLRRDEKLFPRGLMEYGEECTTAFKAEG
jgi:hypothetical protein